MKMFREAFGVAGACLPDYIDMSGSRRRISGIAMVVVAAVLRIASDADFDGAQLADIERSLESSSLDDPDWPAVKKGCCTSKRFASDQGRRRCSHESA